MWQMDRVSPDIASAAMLCRVYHNLLIMVMSQTSREMAISRANTVAYDFLKYLIYLMKK